MRRVGSSELPQSLREIGIQIQESKGEFAELGSTHARAHEWLCSRRRPYPKLFDKSTGVGKRGLGRFTVLLIDHFDLDLSSRLYSMAPPVPQGVNARFAEPANETKFKIYAWYTARKTEPSITALKNHR